MPEEKPAIHYPPSDQSEHGHDSDYARSPGFTSQIPRSSDVGSDQSGLGITSIRSTSPHFLGIMPTITHPDSEATPDAPNEVQDPPSEDKPTAGRPLVRQWFTKAANYLGNAAHQKLDVSDYNDQKAHRFPEIPGEPLRNPALEEVSRQYSELREQRSRAESTYAASIVSISGAEDGLPPPAQALPRPETSPSRKPRRRDTLEVPTPVHLHRRNESH
jgi:hypothetical protein